MPDFTISEPSRSKPLPMKKLLPALTLLLTPLAFAANEKIAVIPKGTTHSFWKSVEAGARQAGAELGVEILWKGPLKEDDRAQQIGVVQQFVSSGVSAIRWTTPRCARRSRAPRSTRSRS
jgi:ABC-type sugar transport system substrate-binding protein